MGKHLNCNTSFVHTTHQSLERLHPRSWLKMRKSLQISRQNSTDNQLSVRTRYITALYTLWRQSECVWACKRLRVLVWHTFTRMHTHACRWSVCVCVNSSYSQIHTHYSCRSSSRQSVSESQSLFQHYKQASELL